MIWPEHIGKVICGDAIETMKGIPDGVIQCCITSPPYWGLRSYLPDMVQLKKNVPPEIQKELDTLGIYPIDFIGV